jgi:hypothetical protein
MRKRLFAVLMARRSGSSSSARRKLEVPREVRINYAVMYLI